MVLPVYPADNHERDLTAANRGASLVAGCNEVGKKEAALSLSVVAARSVPHICRHAARRRRATPMTAPFSMSEGEAPLRDQEVAEEDQASATDVSDPQAAVVRVVLPFITHAAEPHAQPLVQFAKRTHAGGKFDREVSGAAAHAGVEHGWKPLRRLARGPSHSKRRHFLQPTPLGTARAAL